MFADSPVAAADSLLGLFPPFFFPGFDLSPFLSPPFFVELSDATDVIENGK